MKIYHKDHALLSAFLIREADDYDWRPETKLGNRRKFISKMRKMIISNLEKIEGGADYICIRSISNMGLTTRELRLTPVEWSSRRLVIINLPPNPRNGGINISIKDK